MCQAGNGLRLSVDTDDEKTKEDLIALLGKPRSKDGQQVMAPATIKKDTKSLNPAPGPTGRGPIVSPPTARGPMKVPGLG